MKDLLKYLRHYVKESILAPLFKMLEASFELFVPLVIAAIIDTGIKNSDKPYIFKMVMVLVALAVVGFISALTAQYFAAKAAVGFGALLVQGVATSIDALSVGFTISEYTWQAALTEALIIGAVTFVLCLAGLWIGRRFGTKLAGKASILGGVILIAIGLEICITGLLK